MKKGTKIALGIGIPVVLGVTYLILRSNARSKGCAKTEFGATIYGIPFCPKK